jgi:hypothetical protein
MFMKERAICNVYRILYILYSEICPKRNLSVMETFLQNETFMFSIRFSEDLKVSRAKNSITTVKINLSAKEIFFVLFCCSV